MDPLYFAFRIVDYKILSKNKGIYYHLNPFKFKVASQSVP